jgi:hypothetical protein
MEDYRYDVFLSYRRASPTLDWVKDHFYPLLRAWLPEELPHDPRIFIDVNDIGVGSSWPSQLGEALRSSRCLVAIWSAQYFRSAWCVAEWRSMIARERALASAASGGGSPLIFAVRFSDGDWYPQEAKNTQQFDMSQWSNLTPDFRDAVEYAPFIEAVRDACRKLAKNILDAPAWRPDWPIETPEPEETPEITLPRLR